MWQRSVARGESERTGISPSPNPTANLASALGRDGYGLRVYIAVERTLNGFFACVSVHQSREEWKHGFTEAIVDRKADGDKKAQA